MSTSDAGATQKVSLNPLDHFKGGAGPFVKTNLVPAVIAILISAVANTVLAAAFMYLFFTRYFSLMANPNPQSGGIVQLVVVVVLLAVLAAVIVGFFGSVVNRLVVTGSRGQKEDFGSAFNFVVKRLSKIIVTYLVIFAIFIGAMIVITFVSSIVPVLGVLLSIAGVVAAIVFALRLSYVPLVLVDSNEPGKPFDVFRRSTALWNKSQWPLVLYFLTWLVVYVIFSMFSENSDTYAPGAGSLSPSLYPGVVGFAIGSALISSLLSNIFGTLVYCGQASIYDDAAKLLGGTKVSASAPQPPK